MKRKPLTPNQRAELFMSHEGKCVHCGGGIMPGDAWHVAHITALALGGSDTLDNMGPAHDRCNLRDAREHVAPRAAKVRRQRQKHLGFRRKSRPIPGSRASGWKHKMNGAWERRDKER